MYLEQSSLWRECVHPAVILTPEDTKQTYIEEGRARQGFGGSFSCRRYACVIAAKAENRRPNVAHDATIHLQLGMRRYDQDLLIQVRW